MLAGLDEAQVNVCRRDFRERIRDAKEAINVNPCTQLVARLTLAPAKVQAFRNPFKKLPSRSPDDQPPTKKQKQ